MYSIPCANLEIAMEVAYGQLLTINIVQSEGLTVGWRDGKTVFAAQTATAMRKWVDKLGLKERPFFTSTKRRKKSGKK